MTAQGGFWAELAVLQFRWGCGLTRRCWQWHGRCFGWSRMNVSLYQAAAGMQATARWQEIIADNLAASTLPGFKRQAASFGAVAGGLVGPNASNAAQRHNLPLLGTTTDFSPGELKPAGPTDLAIEGKGFFEVTLPNGGRAYTRDGEFHLNAQGQMVSKQGYLVEGSMGPIQVDPANSAPLSVSATGEVSQGAIPKGTLRIVDFPDPGQISDIGEGLFVNNDPDLRPIAATNYAVHQGALEGANASSIREMADLITSARLFEANQKVIQSQDERLARLISEVGNPN
jgi:flagellar basal-body rod protein FlgG